MRVQINPGTIYRWGTGAVALAGLLWWPPAVPGTTPLWIAFGGLLLVAALGYWLAPTFSRDVADGIAAVVLLAGALLFDARLLASVALAAGLLEWGRYRLPWREVWPDLAGRLLGGYAAHAVFVGLLPVARYPSLAAVAAAGVLVGALGLLWSIEAALDGHRHEWSRHALGERLQVLVGFAGLGLLGAAAWGTAPLFLVVVALPCALLARLLDTTPLWRYARVDPPTGLPNATAFFERGEEELARGLRFGRPAALALLALDMADGAEAGGAETGEAAALRVARVLRANARSYDLAARLDTTRFAVLLPEAGQNEAMAIAERLRGALARAGGAGDGAPPLATVSVGLAVHPQHGDSLRALLDAAEGALRQARERESDRAVVASTELGTLTRRAAAHVLQAQAPESTGQAATTPTPLASPPSQTEASAPAPTTMPVPPSDETDGAPRATTPLRRVISVYVGAVCFAAILLFALTFRLPQRENWPLYLALVVLGIAAQHFHVEIYGRGNYSVGVPVLITCAVLLGPTNVMLLGVIMGLVRWPWNVPPIRYIFDAASHALVFGLAALLVPPLDALLPDFAFIYLVLQGLLLGGVAYVLNVSLALGVMSLSERANPLAIWRERFNWLVPHTLALSVLGAFIAWAYTRLGLAGLFIFTVPVVMMRLVTKQFVDRTKAHVAELRKTHAQLSETNQRLRDALTELERSYAATLTAFSRMLDARDSETEGHSQRVVAYAMAIGRAIGLGPHELSALEVGALLHDIGKIGVSDAILRKPGALTPDEWAEMRQHPEIGYRLTQGITFLQPASPVVRNHHERWDGGGYPDQLHGEDIPLLARIFTVADAFDAMVSDRPYRRALPVDQAVREIERGAGVQFDPMVVEAFVTVVENAGWLDTPDQPPDPLRAPADASEQNVS